jgi:hypothetical protein
LEIKPDRRVQARAAATCSNRNGKRDELTAKAAKNRKLSVMQEARLIAMSSGGPADMNR